MLLTIHSYETNREEGFMYLENSFKKDIEDWFHKIKEICLGEKRLILIIFG